MKYSAILIILGVVAGLTISCMYEPLCFPTSSRVAADGVEYQLELCQLPDGVRSIDGEEPRRIMENRMLITNTAGIFERFLQQHPQEEGRGLIFAFDRVGRNIVVSDSLARIDTRAIGPDWYPPNARFLVMRQVTTSPPE